MESYRFIYKIEGLDGSYDTLQDARSMARWYLQKDGIEAEILRGMRGMGRNYIIRHNLLSGRAHKFMW